VAPSTSTPAENACVDIKAKQQTSKTSQLPALLFFFSRSIRNHHITSDKRFWSDFSALAVG
jgi:hypothetical protein